MQTAMPWEDAASAASASASEVRDKGQGMVSLTGNSSILSGT